MTKLLSSLILKAIFSALAVNFAKLIDDLDFPLFLSSIVSAKLLADEEYELDLNKRTSDMLPNTDNEVREDSSTQLDYTSSRLLI